MKSFLKLVAIALLLNCLPATADQAMDAVTNSIKSASLTTYKPHILFLEKTTKFVVPEHSMTRLAKYENYGGAKFAYYFAGNMIKYFEANGYPNLMQILEAGSTDQLDEIAKNYSFQFVYEGPDDDKAFSMFINYSGQIDGEVFHWGWVPKSGEAHIICTTTPKVSTFSATSDGKTFKVMNPILELPTSIWGNTVKPVFDKWGKQGNRT